MTTEAAQTAQTNEAPKTMIAGANTEGLKTETPPAEAPPENKLYPTQNTQADAQKTDEQKVEGQKDDAAQKTDEQKTGGENKTDDKKTEEGEGTEKAPEPVNLSDLALPEGFTADKEVITGLETFVNENKLTKEAAEKLVPLGVKIAEKAVAQINEGYLAVRQGWRDAVVADPVLGTKEAMALANKGLEAYGSPALRTLLEETGLGDHPAVIGAFHKIGKTVVEDAIERGGSGDTYVPDAAARLYPSMKK